MNGQDLSQTASIVRQGNQDFAHFRRVRIRLETADVPAQETVLALEPVEVGSSKECELVCTDPLVSRRHCVFRREETGFSLEDLGSKNGTFVNGVRISKVFVEPGQRVAVGDSRLELVVENGISQLPLHGSNKFGGAVGGSLVMRQLFAELNRAAQTDSALLLWGETGTGKELIARAVHDLGPRQAKPFVIFDCGAVTETLLEATLFGHEKGAFSGADTTREGLVEEADGGTLFLDELGELSLTAQTSLLRLLEHKTFRRVGGNKEHRVDVRVIAATHRDLKARVATQKFREDLYFRIAVLEMTLPPLRQRLEDLPLLIETMLATLTPAKKLTDLPPGLLEMFRHHSWPGNVRELKNVLERILVFPDAPVGELLDGVKRPQAHSGPSPFNALPLRQARDAAVEHFEKEYFRFRLKEHGGNVAAAATSMGVSRQFLYRMLAKYGVQGED